MSRPNAEDRRIPPAGAQFGYVTAEDGVRLRTAHWPSHSGPSAETLVFQTGRTEFIEKGFETVHDLLDRGFAVFMMDWRGQGLSDRPLPDRHKGHIDNYELYLSDFHQFVTESVLPFAHEAPLLLAHSMGGHITLRHLHDHPEHFRAAVFTGPMVDLPLSGPLRPIASGLAHLMAMIGGRNSYSMGQGSYDPDAPFEDNPLTTDPDRFADLAVACEKDPDLALGGVTTGWIIETLKSAQILNDPSFLREIKIPILLQYGTDDHVVSTAAIRRAHGFLDRAFLLRIEGAKHEILKEQDAYQDIFWDAFDSFLESLS